MSVNLSGSDMGDIDYSDFEYQHLNVQYTANGENGESNLTGVASTDVLGGIGGLANNEVAELVALELYASLEFEAETGNQEINTFSEMRGTFGANLDADPADEIGENNPGAPANMDSDLDNETTTNTTGGSFVTGRSSTRDDIFQHYRTVGFPQITDGTDGVGAGGSVDGFYSMKNFRDLVGRGPVLDSNDDLTVLARVVNANTAIDVRGDVRIWCAWDVAEVDDAGRAFSVPM
jgi:hypothetical protein